MQNNKTHQQHHVTGPRRTSIAHLGEFLSEDLDCLAKVLQFQSTSRFFKDFCVRRWVDLSPPLKGDDLFRGYLLYRYAVPFLYCSYCAESLYFWLDVENYQNLPGGGDYMNRTALKIYHKYIVETVSAPLVGRHRPVFVTFYFGCCGYPQCCF